MIRWLTHWVQYREVGRQFCKVCGQTQEVDFVVSDTTWGAVVPCRWGGRVVCLGCFEEFAARQGIHTVRVFLPGGP